MSEKKLLVVVDVQNDFVDGALGSPEAQAIVPNVEKKILEWDGDIAFTMDTHKADYLYSNEGKNLPVIHCVEETDGWQLNDLICVAAKKTKKHFRVFTKNTFGSTELAEYIREKAYAKVEFVGLCTDICVVSNALLTKAFVPEAEIFVDASCCAGVTIESHNSALATMKSCQVKVIND